MRFLPGIGFGTEGYPERIARRLRAANITAWLGAMVPAVFAFLRFLDPTPGMWRRGALNAGIAAAVAAIPLLHRFGPLAAPLALFAIAYTQLFRTTLQVGTDGGAYLYYLSATALMILLIGPERIVLNAFLGALGAGAVIALHVIAPENSGLLSPSAVFFGNFITNVVANCLILSVIVSYALREAARAQEAVEREYARSEALLANILPGPVAARLKQDPAAEIAEAHADASVLFADMAGFTALAIDISPSELVRFLNGVFTRLDALVERHGLEKIKTSGDAYMVVAGAPAPRADHAGALAQLALDMRDSLAGLVDPKGRAVPVRIGIASGPVVAGVVGARKFFYDVWGDAVNTASRMESTGEAGKIQVAPETRALLGDRFSCEERGEIEVRGKGSMRTWFLIGANEPRA